MRVLVVFLLGFSLAEGIAVSKCGLRDKVMTVIHPLMGERGKHGGSTMEDTVAKIVCHVELASGFNVSEVNQLTPWNKKPSIQDQHHPPISNSEEVWTLYGLFQLSNHLVCSDDDKDLSETICEMDCQRLIDDDIDDDIMCLRMIVEKFLKDGWNNPELIQMLKLIFEDGCRDEKADEYFADCA